MQGLKGYLILVPNGRSCPTKGEALNQAQRLTSSGLISSCCLPGSITCRTTRPWGKKQAWLRLLLCNVLTVQCCDHRIRIVWTAVLRLTPAAPGLPCPQPSGCHAEVHRNWGFCLPFDWLKVLPQILLWFQHQRHPSLTWNKVRIQTSQGALVTNHCFRKDFPH